MKCRSPSVLAMLVTSLAACRGGGSDVGPRLEPLPSQSSKVSVFDDQNRGVVGARVAVVGTTIAALTGRNGRADLFADPRGRHRVRVDGSAGAAANGDRLGVLDFAITLPGGDLPCALHLPDTSANFGGLLNVGTQLGQATISASGVGSLTVLAGSSVGMAGGAATVTVRAGSLRAAHLPGDLPTSGTLLMSRGFYVDPPGVTFTPGADLFLVDDLLASPGTVTLYRLDDATGEWSAVGNGIASGGGIQASAGVAAAGLYAFGVAVTAGAVRGRVLDVAGAPVPDVLVHVDGRRTKTGANGVFTIEGIPAVTADGAPRSAAVEVFAGGGWLPATAAVSVAMSGAVEVDAGDITLDTMPCGNIRLQQIQRARAEVMRPCQISSLFGGVALATTSDAGGQVTFEDVPSRWFGFQDAYPKDAGFTYYSQAIGFSDDGRRWLDAFQFFEESAWFTGSRSSRVLATDSVGRGPIYDAVIARGSVDDTGFIGFTREGGVVFSERAMAGRATATLRSERDGRVIVHAFTIETPNGEHLEMPMRQVLRTPLAAFDRHGLVAGAVTGANPARLHRLRSTRRLELSEWWDDVARGLPIRSSLPIDTDPAVTPGEFQAGVDRAGGHLVVAEVAISGGVTTLEKIGLLLDVLPTEGAVIARDLALGLATTATFTVADVLAAIDPAIAPADLRFALALEQPSNRVVDVVRDIGGNHTVASAGTTFTLPALSGPLAGHGWLVWFGGTATGGTATVRQHSLLRLSATGGGSAPPLLAVPTITSPAPSATVASTGFSVQYALPAGAQYATLELRSETASELLLWEVVLPPTLSEFRFHLLPSQAHKPLVVGNTYSLTLSAYAATGGPLAASSNAYRDLSTFYQSIGAAERGVAAVSSVTIQVLAN